MMRVLGHKECNKSISETLKNRQKFVSPLEGSEIGVIMSEIVARKGLELTKGCSFMPSHSNYTI